MALFFSICSTSVVYGDKYEKEMDALEKQYHEFTKSLQQLQNVSEKELRENLNSELAKNKAGQKVVKYFPRLVDFYIAVMKDEQAMNGLFSMAKNRKRLWHFAYVNIALFIISFLWKLSYRKKPYLSWSYWFNCTSRVLVILGCRLVTIVYFFGDELKPTFDIAKSVFL